MVALGGLPKVADLGVGGFALQNATPTLLSYTVPNDGNDHLALLAFMEDVSSALTGGNVQLSVTLPDGTAYNANVGASGAAAGPHANAVSQPFFIVQSGSTITLHQTTAVTVGAAVCWASLYVI